MTHHICLLNFNFTLYYYEVKTVEYMRRTVGLDDFFLPCPRSPGRFARSLMKNWNILRHLWLDKLVRRGVQQRLRAIDSCFFSQNESRHPVVFWNNVP